MRRVHIVVNRCARHLRDDGGLRAAIADEARRGAELFETRTLAELDDACAAIARGRPEAVVLAGGDGSYMAGVTALARAYEGADLPPIALAPGGTVSTVARNWGARGGTRAAAVRAVRAALDGAPCVRRPTLRVRGSDQVERVGFIFGAGLVARFFDVYYASPHQGYAGAAAIVARIFAGSFRDGELARRVLAPTACTVTVDSEERPARAYSLVVASVVRDLGLHMMLTYRAGEELERFHVIASPLLPRELGPQLFRVLSARRLMGNGNVDALARELVLRFEARGAYVLDGEVLEAERVEVRPGPVMRVIEPHARA